jgi:hypothetical protein
MELSLPSLAPVILELLGLLAQQVLQAPPAQPDRRAPLGQQVQLDRQARRVLQEQRDPLVQLDQREQRGLQAQRERLDRPDQQVQPDPLALRDQLDRQERQDQLVRLVLTAVR